MKISRILLVIGLVVIFTQTWGYVAEERVLSVKELFYKGNFLYELEKYDEAADQYNEILNRGDESGSLYYNLGNCYYKMGQYPKSLLYYERAKRLIRRDADLESNYEYVRTLIDISYEEPRQKFFGAVLGMTLGKFNINELFVFIFIVNVLMVTILMLRLFSRGERKYYLYAVITFSVIFLLGVFCFVNQVGKIGKEAIIALDEVSVKFEPQDTATTHFNIYGGEKVVIIVDRGGWVKVKRLDGKIGWLRKENIEII
jgi:hypothetical protein